MAARHLVKQKEIEEIVVADIVPERAKMLATSLEGRKARTVPVTGLDAGSLVTLVKGTDLAINAAHVSIDMALMDACLDARANYMDLSSVPQQQLPLDGRFRKADLTALLGGGEDPGLANVLAREGADRLDTVESIKIRDGDTASSRDTPLPIVWSPETFLDEVFTDGLYFEDGKIVKVPPLSGREVYPFPEPVGPQPTYLMDHEEPQTLGKFIGKGLRYVDLKLAVDDGTVDTLRRLHSLGLLGSRPVAVDGQEVVPRNVLTSLLPRPADLVGRVKGTAMILVEVTGTKAGRTVTYRLWTGMTHEEAAKKHRATATAFLVGTGAAVFASQFARGQVTQKGVIAPECLNPADTLKLMGSLGLPVTHETQSAMPLN